MKCAKPSSRVRHVCVLLETLLGLAGGSVGVTSDILSSSVNRKIRGCGRRKKPQVSGCHEVTKPQGSYWLLPALSD